MFQSGSQNRVVIHRKAVEMDRVLCWYCKKTVLLEINGAVFY